MKLLEHHTEERTWDTGPQVLCAIAGRQPWIDRISDRLLKRSFQVTIPLGPSRFGWAASRVFLVGANNGYWQLANTGNPQARLDFIHGNRRVRFHTRKWGGQKAGVCNWANARRALVVMPTAPAPQGVVCLYAPMGVGA